MNRRLISVILYGVMIAGGASLLLYKLMLGRQVAATTAASTYQLIVASHNLEPGVMIQQSDLKTIAWPGAIPSGILTKQTEIVGRGIIATVYEGEPMVEARLAPVGMSGGLASMIPQGMRAVAIHVNEVVGVAGFVVAGTHVDVLVSGSHSANGDTGADPVTRTILQDITVLSAGQDYKQTSDGKPTVAQVVNLLVTPQQAETLSLAGSQATVQLVLRNPLDKATTDTSGVALSSILGNAPRTAVHKSVVTPPHAPAPPTQAAARVADDASIEIIIGSKRSAMPVANNGEPRQ